MAILKGGSLVGGDITIAGAIHTSSLALSVSSITASPGNFFRSTATPTPTGTATACYDGYFFATKLTGEVASALINATVLNVSGGYLTIDRTKGILGDGLTSAGRNYIWGVSSTYPDYAISYYEGTPDYFAFSPNGTPATPAGKIDGNGNIIAAAALSAGSYVSAGTYVSATTSVSAGTSLTVGTTLSLTSGTLTASAGNFFKTSNTPSPAGTANVCYDGYFYATRLYNAVYNDIADFIQVEDTTPVEVGYVYCYDGKEHHKSRKYAEKGIVGIASDTYGFGVGQKRSGVQIPIAIGGFVLAYCRETYEPGTPLTCDKDGFVKKANLLIRLFHPERVLASFYKQEKASVWNGVAVKGRHWVKVK